MKITKKRLKQIIKEEMSFAMKEEPLVEMEVGGVDLLGALEAINMTLGNPVVRSTLIGMIVGYFTGMKSRQEKWNLAVKLGVPEERLGNRPEALRGPFQSEGSTKIEEITKAWLDEQLTIPELDPPEDV